MKEFKAKQIRRCTRCGDTETIEVIRLMTVGNNRKRCKCIECDSCGNIFEIEKADE